MKHKISINLRALLIVILVAIGMAPAYAGISIVAGISNRANIDNIRNNVQSQGLILADKLSRQGYINVPETRTGFDSEINLVADVFDGRIVIVDSTYHIIKDTFDVSTGKYSIAQEVVNSFEGETSNKYNDDKQYMIQTFLIRNAENDSKIDGVVLFTVSTQNSDLFREIVSSRTGILLIILGAILLIIALAVSFFLLKPFNRLNAELEKVSDGNLDANVDEKTYDITNKLSSSINGTIKRLETVDESRNEFISNVSHELKTPITSIRVLADSLNGMREVPNEIYKEFMGDISEEVEREAQIIDELLELVRMDRSHAQIDPKPVDMANLIKIIMKRVRPQAEKAGVELIFEQVREATVAGDENRLLIALTNIIENGIKYNEPGGSLTVSLDADHRDCLLSITDTGIGIPEEYRQLIFERFYRVDKARDRATGGTGLGLAIAKNIIQLHHGSIDVESTEGEGTVFYVSIPLNYTDK